VAVGQSLAIEDPDVRSAPDARSGDDIGEAIVIKIGGGDAHPSTEARIVSIELQVRSQSSTGIDKVIVKKDPDIGVAALAGGVGPGDDIRLAVIVYICDGHKHAGSES
jgi:hypothetical protein